MRRVLVLLLILAACSPSPTPPPPAVVQFQPAALPALRPGRPEAGCALRVVARYDFVASDAGSPIVMVAANGRSVPMLLDTGAETSVLSPEGAAWLNLAPGPSRRDVLGVGGMGGYGSAQVDSLVFGDTSLHGLDLPIMQLGGTARPGEAPALAGLIGTDLLAPYQVEFDFPRRRMTLYRDRGCGPARPRWAGGDALAWQGARNLGFVNAALDGRGLTALLDTGASHSAVTRSQTGLDAAAFSRDPTVQSIGAGNRAMPGRVHRFGLLEIGGIDLAQPALRIVAVDPTTGIDMLIGMDVLASRRVWFDFPGRRSFLENDGR